MRHLKHAVLALAAFALAPAVSFGQGMTAGTGLAGSIHDFVGGAGLPGNTQPAGLCTFCHTPHKAQSTKLLWNHTLSASTFSWSDATSTTGGTVLPTIAPAYQGASVRCLSCHDGTVAIGDVSWFSEGPKVLNTSTMGGVYAQGVLTGGGTGGGDMKGNHPVAVPFPFGNVAGLYNGITTGTGVDTSEWQANPTSTGIRLFTDAAGSITAGATPGKTGIECSSCHDPHNGKTVPTTSDFFLRGDMTGNSATYICLKCHKK